MKKPIQTYLPEDLIQALEAEAKKQSRSRNSMVEFILRERLGQKIKCEACEDGECKFHRKRKGKRMEEILFSNKTSYSSGEGTPLYKRPPTGGDFRKKLKHDSQFGTGLVELTNEPSSYPIESVTVEIVSEGIDTPCEKCKQPSECRKMYEDGVEHVICLVCALKAKLNWNKLEKLN